MHVPGNPAHTRDLVLRVRFILGRGKPQAVAHSLMFHFRTLGGADVFRVEDFDGLSVCCDSGGDPQSCVIPFG